MGQHKCTKKPQDLSARTFTNKFVLLPPQTTDPRNTQSRSSVWPRLTSTARQAVGRDWPGVQSPPQFGGFGNFSQIGPTPVFSKKSQRCLVQAKTIPSQKSDGTCHDPRAHLAIEAVGALPDMVLARASVRLLARPETWKKKKNGTAQTESLKTMKKGTPSAEPSV